MSAFSSKALHEQLSVIMAALTRAAVAEICELVDEGYAVLQLEISRSRKENEDLKKKLHLIESIVVRGGGGGGRDAADGAEVSPGAEVAQRPETPQRQREGGGGGAAEAAREELPDVVLIKDEDSDSKDTFEEGKTTPADGGAAAAREGVTSTSISRRRRRRWWKKLEAEKRSSSEQQTSDLAEGTQKTETVYTLDSPRSEPGSSGQLGDEVEMETGDSVCTYSPQMDPDVHLVQECSLVPPSANGPVYFSGAALIESPSNRAELDLDVDPTWPKPPKGQVTFTPFHQNGNMDGDTFTLKLLSVSGSTSSDCQMSESSNTAFEYEDEGGDVVNFSLYRDQPGQSQPCEGQPCGSARRKRYVCSVCNKTYATSQNLEVHMRIHTGERPFSCEQCGKKFTQSAHLKSHLSVHTGERPYTCKLCTRSFIVKYSLKLHMSKCHPDAQNSP